LWHHVNYVGNSYYLPSDKGYERILWKLRGYECVQRLRTTVLESRWHFIARKLKQKIKKAHGLCNADMYTGVGDDCGRSRSLVVIILFHAETEFHVNEYLYFFSLGQIQTCLKQSMQRENLRPLEVNDDTGSQPRASRTGLSQIQLHKPLEQYQKKNYFTQQSLNLWSCSIKLERHDRCRK